MKQKNRKAEENKEKRESRAVRGHVPLYRSFAVRRFHPALEKAKTYFARTLGVVILGGLLAIASLAAIFFFLYFREVWIKLLAALLIGSILAVKLTKQIRKRRKFLRKLKRFSRKQGYTLEYLRGFFASFRWSEEGADFVITTPTCRYELQYLTVKRYRTILSVESKDEIKLKTVQIESRFTQIFDFEPREKSYSTAHLQREESTQGVIRGVLVNPVCQEMRYRHKDGGMVATGNGAHLFGYYLFTGSGLLEFIQRNESKHYLT